LGIDKKPTFNWRHGRLATLGADNVDDFTCIAENEEAFFLKSEKSMEAKKTRKRGGKSSKKGISNNWVAVIVTKDRNSGIVLSEARLEQIGRTNIVNAKAHKKRKHNFYAVIPKTA
jgi:uncharacterized protein YwlG (UPF0340 family)